jgi:hypothetical protein
MWYPLSYENTFGSRGEIDDAPDRSNWATKSQKALEREAFGKECFDLYLKRCEEPLITFPVTEVIIQPSNHLTKACWKDFKKHVLSKGCTTKRREVPFPGVKRKSFEIEVTVPSHPSGVVAMAQEKKQKAADDAAARKKRAEELAIINAEKARVEKEKARAAYELIIKRKDTTDDVDDTMPSAKRQAIAPAKKSTTGSTLTSPLAMVSPVATTAAPAPASSAAGGGKPVADLKLDTKPEALLAHANIVFNDQCSKIRTAISMEQEKLIEEIRNQMAKKQQEKIAEARKK